MLRIRNVYPGSRILIFTHPGSRVQKQQQKRGVKKIWCHTFLCSHKFHKIVHYFSFEALKKKIWANFQRIIELFLPKKLSLLSSHKYGFGIRDPEKTYSGSLIQGSKRHRIPDPDPQHWWKWQFLCLEQLEFCEMSSEFHNVDVNIVNVLKIDWLIRQFYKKKTRKIVRIYIREKVTDPG